MTEEEYGVVHGRFQPLHKGHVHYILQSLGLCKRLVIGITNPDPYQVKREDSDPQRHLPSFNPFTYFERLLMIRYTLENDEGISPKRIFVTPLPIHNIDRWTFYLPRNSVHYMVLTKKWDEIKKQRMEDQSFNVEVLSHERYRGISGSQVRQLMIEDGNWEELVPASVVRIIREINGVERIKSLNASDRTANKSPMDSARVHER